MTSFEGFGQTPVEKIEQMASEPLETTGAPPSPEAVAEAKRIALAAAQLDAPAAETDETPPEPEGIARTRLGYAASEKRDTAERDRAAQAMTVTVPSYDGPLPDEVERVWGGGRLDGTGNLAENTARTLIASWGMDEFLRSSIHQAASGEGQRDERMEAVRAAFIKGQKRDS